MSLVAFKWKYFKCKIRLYKGNICLLYIGLGLDVHCYCLQVIRIIRY